MHNKVQERYAPFRPVRLVMRLWTSKLHDKATAHSFQWHPFKSSNFENVPALLWCKRCRECKIGIKLHLSHASKTHSKSCDFRDALMWMEPYWAYSSVLGPIDPEAWYKCKNTVRKRLTTLHNHQEYTLLRCECRLRAHLHFPVAVLHITCVTVPFILNGIPTH